MIKVKKMTKVVFYIFASLSAGLLAYLQVQNYAENHDISYVTTQKFNAQEKDVYPSFSVCLYSSFGLIFKQNKNILGFKGWKGGYTYRKMLLGEENPSSQFREINFDEVAVNLLGDIVTRFTAVTNDGLISEEWKAKDIHYNVPFILEYQDPNQICITRKRVFKKHSILNYERITINAERLYNVTADLHVYIHSPGELTRILHRPTMSFSLNDFKDILRSPLRGNNHYRFQIDHVEIMRKRPDGLLQCNESVFNDDEKYRNVIVRTVGCIPIYWKRFISGPSELGALKLPDCIQMDRLHVINKGYLPDSNVGNATKLYLETCTSMKTFITTTKSSVSESKNIVLQFDHLYETYKVSQKRITHPYIHKYIYIYIYIYILLPHILYSFYPIFYT
jgi:hypothetical protein